MALNNSDFSEEEHDGFQESKNSNPPLNLPPMDLNIRKERGMIKVFDRLRNKFVHLTPEEYVRQHFVNYLCTTLHYPPTIMANEIGIELNGTRKRCDTVIFNLEGKPDIIVEYKAPSIPITQDVFDQIVRYNMILEARYLIVSNGMNHYCCRMDYSRNTYYFVRTIPDYHQIINPSLPN